MKIQAWIYIGLVAIISIGFIGILAASKSDDLTAREKEMVDIAKTLGLDEAKFSTDLKSQELKDTVAQDKKDGEAKGVTGTPAIFINDTQYQLLSTETYKNFRSSVLSSIEQAEEDKKLPVKIEVYKDYNCVHCASFEPYTSAIVAEFGEKVSVVSKNYAFLKDSSEIFAIAAEAANKQGKLIEFSKELFLKSHPAEFKQSEEEVKAFETSAK